MKRLFAIILVLLLVFATIGAFASGSEKSVEMINEVLSQMDGGDLVAFDKSIAIEDESGVVVSIVFLISAERFADDIMFKLEYC